MLPVLVGLDVADRAHDLNVFRLPHVEIHAPNLGDVCAERSMESRAIDADEDAEVDAGPFRVRGAAVGAHLVALELGDRSNLVLALRDVGVLGRHARLLLAS